MVATTWLPELAAPASRRFLGTLSALFALHFVALGLFPFNRSAWLLENVLVVGLFAAMFSTFRNHPLSRASYSAIFVFLFIHEIGAHYTYSLVPYDAWSEAAFGRSLSDLAGLDRNHFDRVIHWLYGLLFFFPARELLLRAGSAPYWVAIALPVDWVLSSSALYELLEWSAAAVFGGDLGIHYLGTQGDVWDAHKDIAFALLGVVMAAIGMLLVDRWRAARHSASESARSSSSQLETSGGSATPDEPV